MKILSFFYFFFKYKILLNKTRSYLYYILDMLFNKYKFYDYRSNVPIYKASSLFILGFVKT